MRQTLADIAIALAAIAAGAVLLLVRPDIPWVRLVLGAPLVMLLPGAALASLVDREDRLGAVEWLTLSVAASIGLTVIAGMALGASVGLTTDGLLVALVAITLFALLAAHVRRSPELRATDDGRHHQHRVTHLALGLAVLLAFSFLVVGVSTPRPARSPNGVVQLWGLPDNAGGLRIGARNVDAEQERYVLTVMQGGQMITRQRVDLAPGASHIFEVKQTAIITTSAPVAISLADESGSLPERTLSVWSVE